MAHHLRQLASFFLICLLAACRSSSSELIVSGRIELDNVSIGSKIGGRVVHVHYAEGQEIPAGAVLIELDSEELNAQMKQAEASLAQAQAQLDLLLAGTRQEELQRAEAAVRQRQAELDLRQKGFRQQEVRQGEAQLAQAQSDLDLAQKNFTRLQQLFQTRAINQQELDRARTTLENAQSQVALQQQKLDVLRVGSRPEEIAEAQANLDQAKADYQRLKNGPRPEEIAAQRAAAAQAEANIERLKAQLAETKISAPANARIETFDLHPGDLVKAGQPLAVLNLKTPPYVRCYIPENRLGWAAPGTEVIVTVDSFPDAKIKGRVRYLSSNAEFTPRNVQTTEKRSELVFEAKVDLLSTDPRLRPGMFADVHFSPPTTAVHQ